MPDNGKKFDGKLRGNPTDAEIKIRSDGIEVLPESATGIFQGIDRYPPREMDGPVRKITIDWVSFEELKEQILEESDPELEKHQQRIITEIRNYIPEHCKRLHPPDPEEELIQPDADLRIDFCTYSCNGLVHIVPVFTVGEEPSTGGERNLVYFPSAFCFHPGSLPKSLAGGWRPAVSTPGGEGMVATVDTGSIEGPSNLNFDNRGEDDPTRDVVAGHGPAIADLVGEMLSPDRSHLFDIRLTDGTHWATEVKNSQGENLNSSGVVVAATDPNAAWSRGFDTDALLAALDRADNAACNVINLSLSATSCPQDMTGDRVLDWLDGWLIRGDNRYVVAASGNHGSCVPVWPAAASYNGWDSKYGLKLSGALVDGVVSVGSRQQNGTIDDFSGHGDWVWTYRPGSAVDVKSPRSDTQWTGTSFSAPQVAAELASGRSKNDVR